MSFAIRTLSYDIIHIDNHYVPWNKPNKAHSTWKHYELVGQVLIYFGDNELNHGKFTMFQIVIGCCHYGFTECTHPSPFVISKNQLSLLKAKITCSCLS